MNTEIKVYSKKPEGFTPALEVAAIYVNIGGEILLLQLAPNKQEGGMWGVPAGKLEEDETPLHAAKRELYEETGINLDSEDSFEPLGELYIHKPEIDYVYHLFCVNLDIKPAVYLSKEHCSHRWVSREEAESLPLMNGAKSALEAYYEHSQKNNYSGASVNVYLCLKKNDEILLYLRENTGYCDGYYGLIAGYVEDNESATMAMIREAAEEAGILVEPANLKFVHAMHRKTDRFNIDLFFECSEWQGAVTSREPDKCAALAFFPLNQLPANLIDYIKDALKSISDKSFYSEQGWEKNHSAGKTIEK